MTSGAHTWNASRRSYTSLEEHIDQIEQSRARQGVVSACPVLEFFKAAPNNDITDVMIAEAFIQSHPQWGLPYLCDVIRTTHWYNNENDTRVLQLNAIHDMFAYHDPAQVRRYLHDLFRRDDVVFKTHEGATKVMDFCLDGHPNPKAFLHRDHVRRHVPKDRDLDGHEAPDFPDIHKSRRKLVGGNKVAKVTETCGDEPYALPMDWIRELQQMGFTRCMKTMHEASAKRREAVA